MAWKESITSKFVSRNKISHFGNNQLYSFLNECKQTYYDELPEAVVPIHMHCVIIIIKLLSRVKAAPLPTLCKPGIVKS